MGPGVSSTESPDVGVLVRGNGVLGSFMLSRWLREVLVAKWVCCGIVPPTPDLGALYTTSVPVVGRDLLVCSVRLPRWQLRAKGDGGILCCFLLGGAGWWYVTSCRIIDLKYDVRTLNWSALTGALFKIVHPAAKKDCSAFPRLYNTRERLVSMCVLPFYVRSHTLL